MAATVTPRNASRDASRWGRGAPAGIRATRDFPGSSSGRRPPDRLTRRPSQGARHAQQLVVARILREAGSTLFLALDVAPADDAVAIDEELSGRLHLLCLEALLVGVGPLIRIVLRHRLGQLLQGP